MAKLEISSSWFHDVDVLEEKLETMKLAAWRVPSSGKSEDSNIIASTAGLLKNQVPSGSIYQKRIRREWEKASRKRSS